MNEQQEPKVISPDYGQSASTGGLEGGDYVLATKYQDGDPKDAWSVGMLIGSFYCNGIDRYEVADGEGNLFRGNGFRRVKKISHDRGRWLLERRKEIEGGSRSVWWWARARIPSNV